MNGKIIKKIYKSIKKGEIITDRFRSSSVELLITHRYLDEKSSFYNIAEQYFDWLLSLNEQLTVWEQFRETTQNWFSTAKRKIHKVFNRYEEALKTAQKKLPATY